MTRYGTFYTLWLDGKIESPTDGFKGIYKCRYNFPETFLENDEYNEELYSNNYTQKKSKISE